MNRSIKTILKILVLTIIIISALLILPKKVLGASPKFKSINGTEITTDSSEEKAVNFYNTLMSYTDSNQLPVPSGKDDTYYKWIGKDMGMFKWDPSKYKFAFSTYLRNIASPSGDKTTTSVCFEPGKDNTADNGVVEDSGKNYYIGQILVIDKENVYLYQKDSGVTKVFHCSTDKINDTYNWQKTLYWAYQAQSNATAAYEFAKYITSTTNWKEDTQKELGRDIINTNYNRSYDSSYRIKDKEHNYRGVFVWHFSGNDSGQGTMFWHVTREPASSEVELNIKKTDLSGTQISGADIYVNANYDDSNVRNIFKGENKIKNRNGTLSSGSSWDLTIVPIDPTKPVKLKISETNAPKGYSPVQGEYEITIGYDYNGKIKSISGGRGNVVVGGKGTDTATVTIKNKPKIEKLTLIKTDALKGTTIAGATFNITLENVESIGNYSTGGTKSGKIVLTGIKTGSNGNLVIEDLVIEDANKDVKITIEETNAPNGYKKIEGKIKLKLTKSGNSYTVTSEKDSTVLDSEFKSGDAKFENNILTAGIKDIPVIDTFNLLKEDVKDATKKLNGAEFKVDFGNIASYYKNGTKKTDSSTTIITGTDTITNILIKDFTKEATITLEETKAPNGYKKIEGKIKLTVKYDATNNEYKLTKVEKDKSVMSEEFTTSNATIDNKKTITIEIKDFQTITLSGQVWRDGQTGVKDVEGPNGKKDDGKYLQGITVYLYNANSSGNKTGDVVETVTTDANGRYEFKDIQKTANGYRIEFEYNGITYENTTYGIDSKAEENSGERITFNARFNTISTGKSNDGTQLNYDYKDGISTLKSSIDGTNPASGQKDFAIKAYTGVYKETTENIDFGLLERYFDLAIGMDIESAKLTINDKETTYSYNQILDGVLDKEITVEKLLEKVQDNSELEYNLYLYSSDYNYRIDDYKMNAIENNVVEVEDGKTDAQLIAENENDTGKELRAFVTYKLVLMNQSTIESAKVNELAYYYDQNYTIYSVGTELDESGIAKGLIKDGKVEDSGIEFKDDSSLGNIAGKQAAKVTGFAQELKSSDYRQVLYFTFEIKKSEDGTRALPKDITCANIAEILSYSTNEGLIDRDSAPGNAIIQGYEDDTDEAPGLNIKVTKNGRTITGTVFEDLDKNGENNDNKPVNDVIVQLIEVKKIKVNGIDNYYEYIWQETRSGSNGDKDNLNVRATKANGYSGGYYTTGNSNGEYKFTGFIPGNYIIRFIYGDGRVYETTDSVEEYNGQDYKSTIDANYNKEWYNTAGYSADENGNYPSVARDNEARRLKVMSYSTTINEETWNKLNSKDETMLQNTWMCAETSKINIPIDTENISTTEPNTAVSFTYKDNTITLGNMNFGLIKRPETKLVLEKHITGLKITPTGTGVQPIVDAKLTSIKNILNNNTIKQEDLTGITTGLSTIKSSRDERGFWKVETDIEELAQGATLEVEYTYVIKDESDVDYLSTYLVGEYKNNPDNYSNILIDKSKEMKKAMREGTYSYSTDNIIGMYLGQYYYTKNEDVAKTSAEESPVLSRVDTVEDYLENQLKLSEQTSGIDFKKSNTGNVTKNMYDTEGNKKDLTIETVIQNKEAFKFTEAKGENEIKAENADYTKTVSLTTTLSASNKEITYPGYIAQIMQYSNAAGRRDMDACPGNLNYIHSEDNEITLNSYVKYNNDGTRITGVSKNPEAGYVRINEDDEYWGCGGEKIMVTKPTGEDKQAPLQIAIIAISSIAVLGVGIVLIKKFVLKK